MSENVTTAIISSVSILLGVLISQGIVLVQSHFSRRHEKNILLRQKYEEMMFYFSESLEWIRKLDCSTSLGNVLSLSQSKDARKALALCLLYFPDVVDSANKYVLALSSYYTSIVTVYNENIPAPAGAQALVNNKEKHELADGNLRKQKNIFENTIVKLAKKYTMV